MPNETTAYCTSGIQFTVPLGAITTVTRHRSVRLTKEPVGNLQVIRVVGSSERRSDFNVSSAIYLSSTI